MFGVTLNKSVNAMILYGKEKQQHSWEAEICRHDLFFFLVVFAWELTEKINQLWKQDIIIIKLVR